MTLHRAIQCLLPVCAIVLAACGSSTVAATDPGGIRDTAAEDVPSVDPGPADVPAEVADPGPPPADVPGDVPAVDTCTPACGERKCGDNGCGGSCGECDLTKPYCNAGVCQAECLLPSSWGPASVVETMQIVDDKSDIALRCGDFAKLGNGQNGLAVAASVANEEFAKTFVDASYVLLFEWAKGFEDWANVKSFDLAGLAGVVNAALPEGSYNLIQSSYDLESCAPQLRFEGARITNGVLVAGPTDFTLAFPVTEVPLVLTLERASITGTVRHEAGRVFLDDALLTGVLTREQVDALLVLAGDYCATATPAPSYCSLLPSLPNLVALLYDLTDTGGGVYAYCDEDCRIAGQGNAASVCFAFNMLPATIAGIRPPVD